MNRCHGGNRVAVWLLALALLVAQSGLPSLARAQNATAAGQTGSEQGAEQLRRVFAALEAAAREVPRDSFDPEAVLDEVDLDAGALFAWVRDNTYLVPYRGALRGPVGVLMDRVGNSLDRALLLTELLQLLGYDTRLARAQLTPEQAQTLLDQLTPPPVSGPLVDEDATAQVLRFVDEFGLDEELARSIIARADEQRLRLGEDVARRVPEQSAFLVSAVGGPAIDTAAARAEQLEALADHWWVQVQEGGAWLDLDPGLVAAEPGETLAGAGEPMPITALSELGEELLHTVQVRVVLECWLEESLHETTLVESPRLLPAELLGTRIALQAIPVGWPQDLDPAAGPLSGEAFETTLMDRSRWVPTLQIGADRLIDRSFDESCALNDGRQALSPMGQLGGTIGDALGGAFDAQPGVPGGEAAGSAITAEWLEYVIRVPGRPEQIIRRQLFDLLGPAARGVGGAALSWDDALRLEWRSALLGETEILVLANDLSQPYLDHLTAQRFGAQGEVLIAMAQQPDPLALQALEAQLAQFERVPGDLYALALGRRAWRTQVGIFLDRPNILSQHVQLAFDAARVPQQRVAFDIVTNDVAVHPAVADAFAAHIGQGVLDTNLEALLAALGCLERNGAACEVQGNAAEVFAQLQGTGNGWTTLVTAADLDRLAPPWPQDALARVREGLLAGYVIVLPAAPFQPSEADFAAWWRVDPASGRSLGMGGVGWGQELAEIAIELGYIAFYVCTLGTAANTGTYTGTQAAKCAMAGIGVAAFASGNSLAQLLALMLAAAIAGS